MSLIIEVDFTNKKVKEVWDTEVEAEKLANFKTCSMCQNEVDKRSTTVIEADIILGSKLHVMCICKGCVKAMGEIVGDKQC